MSLVCPNFYENNGLGFLFNNISLILSWFMKDFPRLKNTFTCSFENNVPFALILNDLLSFFKIIF